jgi:hypothetical protein
VSAQQVHLHSLMQMLLHHQKISLLPLILVQLLLPQVLQLELQPV